MDLRLRSGERSAPQLPVTGGLFDRARRLPRLIVFLLLVCFVVQGIAVQSHVHFVRQANAFLTHSGHNQVEAPRSGKGDSPADCPLCREAAMAGAYVLPASPVVPPPSAPVLWTAAAPMAAFAVLAPPLGWLSRAPPE